MEFGFDVLTLIIAIPTIAGVILLFMPPANRDIIRGVAITAAVADTWPLAGGFPQL